MENIQNKKMDIEKQLEILEANQKKETPMGFAVILREFKKDRLATVSFCIVVLLIAFVFIASMFINMKELGRVDILRKYDVPSFNNFWDILGRDAGGRSIIGLLIVGARNSLIVGFSITILTSTIGLFTGLCMGYYGGRVDSVLMRIVDFIGILPTMLIIIAFVSIIPTYNLFSFIFIMTAFYWTGTARLVRSKALSEARRDYVSASKTMGTSDLEIMFKGILPNISSIIIVDATLALAGNVGIETSLSFLGFGLPASTPSLGTLIAYASKPEIIQYKLYVWLPAAILLLVIMLCINYIGQALRRASDAKQRLG
ncbi:ABC transporter, permease protein [Peptoanaerobacter stomatis]|uniref:ABC transporter, permease protein n=1 Tax=Peptoanaerobacter stomatis TaxID=796937 RepID=J6H3V9_9FIRM|nr:ABC transporter permease [Peptoanaerobacter stomatis]EJU20050.1 ABC transporter, permease protein [Peptoanaerobacter stomatis]NWO25086.1 ABC transporter permease [Peptostreptococcaceae bacterium oral taxon 081]